jgi:protein-disulfide isomerase
MRRPDPRVRAPLPIACAALVVALAVAGCGGGGAKANSAGAHSSASTESTTVTASTPSAPAESLTMAVARVHSEVAGIPQRGLVLGHSGAPVAIIEYGDVACIVCAAVHEDLVPALIARYVRTGRATLELRPVANGTASRALATATYAAGLQGRGWNFVQLVYRRSIAGASAASETATTLARAVGVDVSRWRHDLALRQWAVDLSGAADVAAVAGFGSYPVFLVRHAEPRSSNRHAPAFIVLGAPQTLAQFQRAIAKALREGS